MISRFFKISIIASYLMLITVSGHATFQNWQSDAFKEKPHREEMQQHHNDERLELEKMIREDPSIDREAYYEAIAPKDMERDHDYLLHDHPLQEAPLPTKQVE
ncbi:MAG: hypothetical protein AAGG81_04445 [Chlamydiota bacterium]